ncbi:putative leucine-rich repeat-containing protein DDB_G0290503 isoform X3 [Vespula pensylvanica]|uniref:putative leucine-rich repeat-containing protein DDB_G0290503 isoform X3 n=1 Tax=Vespula pensylvanica TaxID=30213 RepID=UPI001CBA1DA5|nr:putative leucine-rich repeat-containing protein DDB_G0290503 isoform X3 [Vespula pensylvanica]
MPRSIRDSDEDVETKTATGRRTRAGFGSIVTDSPVRRSSRNKQSTKQSGSPPDLYITEISTQGTRTFRTRADTADSDTLETQKRLRSSKNSVDTEFETLIETQPKKMTRRSLAATTALDTPKANTRPRRMTRAGSETISTPIGRTTRKTRASSMDPEPTIAEPVEEVQNEVMNTPMRAKRRASVLPSQSTVIEEEEKQFPIIELEKIVIETETSPINVISTNIKSPNEQLELSKNKSNEDNKSIDKIEEEKDCYSAVKGPLDDSSEKNHMEISETFKTEVKSSDESYTLEKDKYSAANVNDDILTKDVSKQSPHSLEDISKESKSKDENILHVSIEEKKMNSSNKENEFLNKNNSVSEQNKTISNIKNLHQETSIAVLDTKEGKNVESNDNINPDNSHLIESSVSLSDCNNSIKSNSNVNTNEVNYLEEENKSVSMSDTKETPSNEEEHEKTSINSITINENSDESNTVSHKVLVNEDDSIPEEQSKINDSSNGQIQEILLIKEEKSIEIVDQNISNIEEINSNDKIKDKANVSVNPEEKLIDISVNEDNCNNDVNVTEVLNDEKISDSTTAKVISASKDSNVTQESHDIPEADLPDEEGSKMQSSSNTPVMSKTKSVTELNISKSKKEEKKNDVQNDDECENISDIRMLFQDISADEWKQKNKNINIETRSNLMHSTSTGKLETDSETECDLLLVDKKAWLAAEKLKASKDKEKFDYDSDDTIILKTKLDYLNDKLSNTNKIEIKSKDSVQDNDNNSEVKESMERSINSSKSSTKEAKDKLDEVGRTPNKLNDKTNIDKSEIDISSHSASKKEKSQKSTPVCNRSVLVKSLDKQLEEEEVSLSEQVFEDQEAKITVDVINKVEINILENKHERQSLDKKQKKNRSLNSSLNKSDKSKQRLVRHNRLNISSSEEEDNAINLEKNENKLTKGSGKKRYNKNYSTMVHIGSDSDTCDESIDSSNSGIRNKTPRIPRFLFKHKDDEEENEGHNNESGDESNEDKFSDRSIDSDINAEYNLDGKTIGKFSDDDIPGDECRASESEFSDPDDNGSDLADFVVDDDEVEEEDEEEDEGEDEEDDEGEDEEQEEEKENQDIESEEDKKLTENKNEKKEAEGTEDTEKSCEKKLEDIDEEEVNKEAQNKSINVSDIKSDKKKNLKQKVNIEIHISGSDEDEIVCENKIDTISELDSNTSGKKPKKKQKLNEDNEIIEETSKKELNESEIVFAKKVKGTNISLTCSTPKTDTFQQKQFNKQNISSNEEQENIHLKDLSSDNCDASKSSITNSKNSKKKRSIENNISTDLLELLKDVNLPKTLLSKKAYLNKTISPCSETPTTKYLKKQKLNDSAPNINLEKNKNASETELIDDKNDEQSESRTITAETTELLESNSSASIKRKRHAEINDSNDQIELRNKKNKINSKLEIRTGFDNEKENSENVLKVNDEKKKRKRKKNKKNKDSKELDLVNIATTVEKKNIEKGEKMDIVTSNESKKNKKKNKNKENMENKDKSNEKFTSTTKNDKKSVEIENIPNKKKKKTMSEVPTLQVKEQSKKSLRKNILKSSTMSVAKVSNEMPQNTEFFKSKHEALEAAKRAAESIKANKDMNKNKQRKQLEKIQQEKDIKVKKSDQVLTKTFTRGIKRLPADVIENLSDVPMNPFKKTKLLKNPVQQTVRSPTSMMKNGFTESGITKAKKNYIPSNSGGTTEFDVVNLQKEKKLKKTSTVVSFRNKMLSRNSRYPVTSYIMYLQKQKVSNKDQCFAKQF